MSGGRCAAGALVATVLLAGAAGAAVTVQPFAASDDLALFAPEIARVLAVALDRAGAEPAGQVSGRLEAVDHDRDRVRLRASVAGRAVQVEGLLEEVDELTNQLAEKIVAALPPSARRPVARPPSPPPGAATTKPASPTITIGPTRPAAPPASRPPISPAPPAATPTSPPADPVPPVSTVPLAPPSRVEPSPVEPPPSAPTVVAPAAEERPDLAVAPHAEPVRPPPAPESPTTTTMPSPFAVPPSALRPGRLSRLGVVLGGGSGRAVLRQITTPEGCELGSWATIGARDLLERRLRVQVATVGGCGFASPAAAATEAAGAGVRAVVMGALETLRLVPADSTLGARPSGRLRVMVVRDGVVALDRTLDVIGNPSQTGDLSRAVYDLVTIGFGQLGGELRGVLFDAR